MKNRITLFKKNTSMNTRAFVGFTVVDVIHVVCAVALLIYAYSSDPVLDLLAAQCGTEIVFSLLLVAFIASLAEHNEHHDSFHALYTFAWLTALASLLVPSSFSIPELSTVNWTNHSEALVVTLDIAYIVCILAAFVCTFITSFVSKRNKTWNRLIHVSMILVLISVPLEICSVLLVGEHQMTMVFESIKALAPIVPAVLSLTLWKNDEFRNS